MAHTAIGLDIGGTKISAARVCPQSGVSDFEKTATPTDGRAFVGAIESLVKPLMQGAQSPVCLGIASAGTVNSDTGEIFGSTGNLPALRDIGNLKESLEKLLQIPVFLENDANAAAYGEAQLGAGKGHANALMITLGTGVGAGIVFQNQLVRGAHFSAAEGGHICISMAEDRLCTCGRWGCWEAYASGTGLAQTARQQLHATPNAKSSPMLEGGKAIDDVTTHDLIRAWKDGDAVAQHVLNTWHEHIAVGLGSLLNVLDPHVTVIGGGMAEFVDYSKLTTLTRERSMYQDITLLPATLGNQAGIVGAALLALGRLG